MVLASMAMAGDRQMKKLLVGTWTDDCTHITTLFQSDGKLLWDADDPNPHKWDIEDGQLIDWRRPGSAYSYTILFLTKHEFLALVNRGDGRNYIFFKR